MLKYIGDGDFLQGVPARDLNDAEVARFGGERALLASGLYQKPIKRGKIKPPKAGREEEDK